MIETGNPGTTTNQPRESGAALLARCLSPRTMTAAYLIWADCQMHGWDRSATEIADSTGMTCQRVTRTLTLKRWETRIRTTRKDTRDCGRTLMTREDAQAPGIPGDKPWLSVE